MWEYLRPNENSGILVIEGGSHAAVPINLNSYEEEIVISQFLQDSCGCTMYLLGYGL